MRQSTRALSADRRLQTAVAYLEYLCSTQHSAMQRHAAFEYDELCGVQRTTCIQRTLNTASARMPPIFRPEIRMSFGHLICALT